MPDPVAIPTRVVQGAAPGPRLLITGGVHGDEFEPMAASRRLIDLIDPATLRGRVTIAPVVNLPAFRRARRCAEDDLDLARACPGDPNGSITQRIAHALTALIRDADAYIDLHTGGTTLSILPMAGYMLHADESVRRTQRRMAQAFNLPIVWGTSAELEGRSLSAARDAKVPAIYAEYGGAAVCDPNGVRAYVEGCLNVMATLGMIDRPAPASRVVHVVDDPRPASGHMQRCNPAPADGCFEPAVKLGQALETGDLIGAVVGPLGERLGEVRSHESGIVLVLRTLPSVRQGDSVAVILPLATQGANHG